VTEREPDTVAAPVWTNSVAGLRIRDRLTGWLMLAAARRGSLTVTLAAGYLSFHGLIEIAAPLRRLLDSGARVRILLGVCDTGSAVVRRESYAEPDLARLLREDEAALGAELDGIPMSRANSLTLTELLTLLARPELEVRRYERGFFHAKLVLAERPGLAARAMAGSFNLTRAGLTSNVELAVEPSRMAATRCATESARWWDNSVPFSLHDIVEDRFVLHPAELVYLRMLAERFRDELDVDSSELGLLDFQLAAVAEAMAMLRRHGGALVADEVGLGKTFVAGEIIRRENAAGAGRVLILCPAHLRRAVWKRRNREWGLGATVLSYDELRNRVARLQGVDSVWDQFTLIVCDEAHYLRNPSTCRRTALETLIAHQVTRPHIVLLTATPVNNLPDDLTELIELIAPAPVVPLPRDHGFSIWERRRLSRTQLKELCRIATHLSEGELRALREEISLFVVRRTRQGVKTAYPEQSRIRFPTVHQHAVRYTPTPTLRALFADTMDAMAVPGEQMNEQFQSEIARLRGPAPHVNPLNLAAYLPSLYELGDDMPMEPPPFNRLMRILLLKRLESSTAAFASTAWKMAATAAEALADLDLDRVKVKVTSAERSLIRDLLDAVSDTDSEQNDVEDALERLLAGTVASPGSSVPKIRYRPAADYDVPALREALESDVRVLTLLAQRAEEAIPHDPKAKAFLELLNTLDGKAIVFAEARASTSDLGMRLESHLAVAGTSHRYNCRVANLGTELKPSSAQVGAVLAGFCPGTAADLPLEIGETKPADLYDLLITTDCLSEGVNLQQASIVINYDLPWNPMRIAQRIGRADRLGSDHDLVDCYTFLPSDVLDAWLCLVDTLRQKTLTAVALVGQSVELFPEAPVEVVDFASAVSRLEKDCNGQNPAPSAALLHRAWIVQAWRNKVLRRGIEALPAWAGAIHPSPVDDPFVVFCLQVQLAPGAPARPVYCRVHARGRRFGAICLDTATCLDDVRLDLSGMIAAGCLSGSTRPQISAATQSTVIELLRLARRAVVEEFSLHEESAEENIRVVAWIYRGSEPCL